MIQKFEDLEVWKESFQLSVDIYKMLKECKDFGLRDQLQRASVSIPSNIAEGFERNTNKDFIKFLYISKSSCGELRTQLYIYKTVGLFDERTIEMFIERTRRISAMLYKLIQTRKDKF